ncbi:bugT protein [Pollutimonas subterranea]|uniref:BugT protein n=2 Tax=Pollutimonas subterranea TaxID=2045210 RepID=A0A2N4U8L6_9BURK|nr:bugT protein [Pollutimonas subterranea]
MTVHIQGLVGDIALLLEPTNTVERQMTYKKMCTLLTGFLGAFTIFATHAAPSYPNKPVRLIVPWPAGGSADTLGRSLGEVLGQKLDTPVIIENVAGASGTIGTQQMVRAAPDGYTLLLATSSANVSAPNLYKSVNFDPIKDFSPIGAVALIPSILIVPNDSKYGSARDIVAGAKRDPGVLSYGSGGIGNSGHLSAELFLSATDTQATHIPYKGNNPALVDLIGGRLDFMFDNGAVDNIKTGRIKGLAVASENRIKTLPEVPTFKELGMPGVELSTWFGLAAPAATPDAIIKKVNTALNEALEDPSLAKRLIDMGADIQPGTAQEFSAFWASEFGRYKELIRISGAAQE